jgi:hypothetical protein
MILNPEKLHVQAYRIRSADGKAFQASDAQVERAQGPVAQPW